MGIWARILVVGFLAMYHGLAMGAAIQPPNEQESIDDSTPITTISMFPETTFTHASQAIVTDASQRIRTTQVVDAVNRVPSESSTLAPTRAGEDTSRPHPYTIVIAKTARDDEGPDNYESFLDLLGRDFDRVQLSPRDDYDGYGYGSIPGSGVATPITNGGYGSPPATTALLPGGYGDPPPPAVDKPSIATVSDPVTVTVSLETRTSSLFSDPPEVVTVTVTSTPVPQIPVQNQNITHPVIDPDPTSPPHPIVTGFASTTSVQQFVPVPVDDPPPTSAGGTHTPATMSSASHTPTHTPPKPVTDTNAALETARLGQRLLFVAASLAAFGVYLL
ncbi:hypothetical protein GGR53DRAFT_498289 [Hypoxylon sp. FL1150]|nr:hypothetical protein GGR53DRAFT_498289 [Hypoxylon sp. FL1150]